MIPLRPKPLLAALIAERVDFVLVGGLAGAIHGTTRVTKDIDIAYATNAANLARLCTAINQFEPRRMVLGRPEGGILTLTPEMLKRDGILQIATSAGEVDLLDRIQGFSSYGFVRRNAETIDIGVDVPILSIDGLLRAKRAMKRPKDLHDIVELEALQEAHRLQCPEDDDGRGMRFRQP